MLSFAILAIISFLGTYYVMPHSIRKLSDNGYVAKDMYKPEQNLVPTNAGIIMVFTSFIAISLMPLLLRLLDRLTSNYVFQSDFTASHLALLLVVSVYALYGLVDDLVDVGRKLKFFLPVAFSFPLISVIQIEYIWLPIFGDFDLNREFSENILYSDFFKIIIVPIYVMVVANLVNMHSGYNGLQSGLSIIILSTLIVKSYLDEIIDNILPVGGFFGSILAFYIFNRYPSKVFEGNIGSLLFGSLIGCTIVIQNLWWFGFFILIPHTFNFLLWIYWLYLMNINPDEHLNRDGNHSKFGYIRSNKTLAVPNNYTLKWIANYNFDIDESTSTKISFTYTGLFCLIGLFFL